MRSKKPAAPPPARTLVFHQAALGDFVLTWPLLRRLPGPVAVVAPWSHATLAAASVPGVTAVGIEQFEFTRMHATGGPTALSPAVRELFEDATRVVSFVASPGGDWAANAKRLLPHTDRVLLDPRPPEGFAAHVSDWHAQAVSPAISLADPATVPPGPPAAEAAAILLHPGSGGVMKCWPRARFAELARRLAAAGHACRFVLGEAEAERFGDAAMVELGAAGIPIDPLATLDALADAIRGCRLYVGNDAGPTHLAAQLGVPTLALFGPSSPERFHPLGPASHWLAPPKPTAMHWLSVDACERRIRDALGG